MKKIKFKFWPKFNIFRRGRSKVAHRIKNTAKDIAGVNPAIELTSLERVTNDTVAKSREEILSRARRFVYPLQHSKYRIAYISGLLLFVAGLALITISWVVLYQRQSTSDFAYRMSQIIPFPVARVGGDFVRFEEYLFELRQNTHYLVTQEHVDFSTPEGQIQLNGLKQVALDRTIDNAILNKLAKEHNIRVTEEEVDAEIAEIRAQGGVGENIKTLEDTLQDFYGWTINDWRRVIKNQLIRQKLLPVLDTEARAKAEATLEELKSGAKFEDLVKKYSDDSLTKDKNGELGSFKRNDPNIPKEILNKAFELKEGEVSDQLVQSRYGYHIVKNNGFVSSNEVRVAHIMIKFKDPFELAKEYREKIDVEIYVHFE